MGIRESLKNIFQYEYALVEYHFEEGWADFRTVLIQLWESVLITYFLVAIVAIFLFNGIGYTKRGFYLL